MKRFFSGFGRRAMGLLVVGALLGIPAGALRAMCFNGSCETSARASSKTPFCSLPRGVRDLVASGFYEGRSPDLMAVTGTTSVLGGSAFPGSGPQPLWPSAAAVDAGRVPIVLSGVGVDAGTALPPSAGVDTVSATIARIIGLRRPNPDVRSGSALDDVATGEHPRLVLEVVWAGVGSDELEASPDDWPELARLMNEGAGTLDGRVGSLPLDPAATITTIGTGGLPSQHGITGTLVRSDDTTAEGAAGEVVSAWGPESPTSVIATLGDHLDEGMDQRPVIGVVADDPSAQGLIGGHWYATRDDDVVRILGRSSHASVAEVGARVLRSHRFGNDETPDLLGVVVDGDVKSLDSSLSRLVDVADEVSDGSFAVVVTATGRSDEAAVASSMSAARLAAGIEREVGGRRTLIDSTAPGGLFLDQERLETLKISDDAVLEALLSVRGPDGDLVMADAFPAIAISFGRYC